MVNKEKNLYYNYAVVSTNLSHFSATNSAHMIDFLNTSMTKKIYDAKN